MWKDRVSHCFDVTSILTKGILLVGGSKTDDGLRKVTEDIWKDIIFYNIFYWEGVSFVHKTKLSITLTPFSENRAWSHEENQIYSHCNCTNTVFPIKEFWDTLHDIKSFSINNIARKNQTMERHLIKTTDFIREPYATMFTCSMFCGSIHLV